METPPSFPLLSYSPLSLSVLLFFFPSSLFFRFHRLIDINPRYPAVYHAALPTIPFVEPPFPLRFRRCSTWVNYESDIRGKYRYGNIGGGESGEFISMVLLRRSALLPLDGVDHEWRETNLSRWFRGDLKVWGRAASQANVISRATKQESAPNRRRNRFDEIKPGLGWQRCTPSRWLILLRGIILRAVIVQNRWILRNFMNLVIFPYF